MDLQELREKAENMTQKELEKGIAKFAVMKREGSDGMDILLGEYLRRGFEGGSAKSGKYKALIYYVKNSVSRVLDTDKIKDYFGDRIEAFKKDKYNEEHYAVKLVDSTKRVN